VPTEGDLAQVRAFTEPYEFAWITCKSSRAAPVFEGAIKRVWIPPLTKR
jgi:hypothetical protein